MKKRKLSFQKIFNLVSAVFILTCCLFYGGRFVKLYLENKEKVVVESHTLGKTLRENNKDLLKNINNEYYFTGKVESNYVTYSGILWRVIKIGENNVVTLVSDNNLSSLAFGENVSYEESYINKWLNSSDSDYSGILEKNLNSKITYLKETDLCTNKIDDISNSTCNDINNDYFITLLSVSDYINTGAADGFINNSSYFYLSNINSDNKVWYVNSNGKVDTSNGNDIYGVRPVIKFKDNIGLVSGTGTKEDPYIIESTLGLFGSFVQLGDDIWRVIDVNDDKIKLMYNDYIKDGEDYISYKYSVYNAYHDDAKYGTLAYYMNKTFLDSLSYKDMIIESNYSNGYYGIDNKFDYAKTLESKINTKVALVSIGDIIFNNDLGNYFTLTSSAKNNKFVYTIQKDGVPYSKITSSANYVVPVITISKDNLEGKGTIKEPLKVVTNNE